MNKLKSPLNNKWFFPALFYYGIFYILFGEWYPKTVSTDGFVFLSLVQGFTNSLYFETYYFYRIVPALIIRIVYIPLSIDLSAENIFIGFQIINLISIVVSCIFLKNFLFCLNYQSINNYLVSFFF